MSLTYFNVSDYVFFYNTRMILVHIYKNSEMSTISLSLLNEDTITLNSISILSLMNICAVETAFHPVIVENCICFSVLLCFWPPLVSHYLLLPSIPQVPWWEAILEEKRKINQCCREQEAWILHMAKAYYVSANNTIIFGAFMCACVICILI